MTNTQVASKEHWAKLIEAFRLRHTKLAALMLRAKDDLLTYRTVPQAHWRQIYSFIIVLCQNLFIDWRF